MAELDATCERCGAVLRGVHLLLVGDPPAAMCMTCLEQVAPELHEAELAHRAMFGQWLKPPKN
jgi:hypothetical protein